MEKGSDIHPNEKHSLSDNGKNLKKYSMSDPKTKYGEEKEEEVRIENEKAQEDSGKGNLAGDGHPNIGSIQTDVNVCLLCVQDSTSVPLQQTWDYSSSKDNIQEDGMAFKRSATSTSDAKDAGKRGYVGDEEIENYIYSNTHWKRLMFQRYLNLNTNDFLQAKDFKKRKH